MEQEHRQHAQACEQEAIEHHVLDAHFVQGQPAEIKARSPEATGHRACAITQELYSAADPSSFAHLSLLSHTGENRSDSGDESVSEAQVHRRTEFGCPAVFTRSRDIQETSSPANSLLSLPKTMPIG
jgi:hypothetical protein